MLKECEHPLFGKETVCHKCSGVAVWVFNGDMVGNYHYCRACKVETGPFASSTPPPSPVIAANEGFTFTLPELEFVISNGAITKRKMYTPLQVDTQMQMEDRMDQLLFDFMKPPGETL